MFELDIKLLPGMRFIHIIRGENMCIKYGEEINALFSDNLDSLYSNSFLINLGTLITSKKNSNVFIFDGFPLVIDEKILTSIRDVCNRCHMLEKIKESQIKIGPCIKREDDCYHKISLYKNMSDLYPKSVLLEMGINFECH